MAVDGNTSRYPVPVLPVRARCSAANCCHRLACGNAVGQYAHHHPRTDPVPRNLLPGVQGIEGYVDQGVQYPLVNVGSCLTFGAAPFAGVGNVFFVLGGVKDDLLPLCFEHAVIGGSLRSHLDDHGRQIDGDDQALQKPHLGSDAPGGILELVQGTPARDQPVVLLVPCLGGRVVGLLFLFPPGTGPSARIRSAVSGGPWCRWPEPGRGQDRPGYLAQLGEPDLYTAPCPVRPVPCLQPANWLMPWASQVTRILAPATCCCQ